MALTPVEQAQREGWRKAIIAKPRPADGCFAATYPDNDWHAVPCAPPKARRLQLPYRGGGPPSQNVGNGYDISAHVTTPITQAEGSFDSVTTTGEQDSVYGPGYFGLQLNTDFFSTATCSTSPTPASCSGWEQFVFLSDGEAYIQYWLINFGPTGTTCPAPHSAGPCNGQNVYPDGWCEFSFGGSVDCAANSANTIFTAAVPAVSLAEMKVTGTAATGGGSDQMCATGSSVQCTNGSNYFPDLATQWQYAEFNVFGFCCGYEAIFNPGTTLVVRTSVNNGSNAAPGCGFAGFTGETNNLSFFPTAGNPAYLGEPALVFTESNVGTPPAQSCAQGVSVGYSTLTVAKAGPGTGTVTSSPGGISCGATCSGSFLRGSMVTLSAVPDTGYAFTGWSGGGCSGNGTCNVTMGASTTVTATFGNNPVPVLTSISPASVAMGGAGFTLTVNGTGFVSGPSVVKINGNARGTTYISATQMTASILASDIATTGTATITVYNPAPGGGTSAGQTLTITAGPSINVSSTSSPPGGAITATLMNTPNGANDWVTLAVVGSPATSYGQWAYVRTFAGNPKTWTVAMPATLGNYEFRYLLNNGYTEAAVSPSVTVANINPTPVISSVNPASVVAGVAGFSLTVNGTGYVNGATATVGGISRAVTFMSATQLSVAVQASDVSSQGNAAIVVTNPASCTGGICGSNSVNLSITAPPPAPVLTSISPTTANAGGPNFTLTATGTSFAPNSVVQINGVNRATVFVSATQLTATILAADIASAGPSSITVFTPTPGGGTSSSQTLTVSNPPAPVLTSISPTTVASGGAAFTLTANGSSFTASSVVKINGTTRTTTFVNATQLTASILASDIATGGTPTITVFTPTPGGGTSSGQTLTVTGPTINVSATTSPPSGSITATLMNTPNASKDWVALALVGSANTVYVQWVEVSALSGNPKTWTVTMPATLGNYEFRYFLNNGYTEAAVSPAVTVANINPTPTIGSLSPPSVVAGVAAFPLTVNGSGYVNGATATVGGISRGVTFVSATQLTVGVQASDVASQGNAAIVVTNPGTCTAGNCVSNSVNLSITAPPPPPILTSINPTLAFVGTGLFTINATGANFQPNSVVQINGVARATVSSGATYVNANILASDITAPGPAAITVYTPPPGGGTSAPQVLAIDNLSPNINTLSPASVVAGSNAFTLTVNGGAFTTGITATVNGVSRPVTLISYNQLSIAVQASDVVSQGSVPVVVTNIGPCTPGCVSNSVNLSVTAAPPAPVLTSISPTSVASGGATFTLTANGNNFTANSVVKINGTARATVFVNASQLTATILASDIASSGTPTITVFTPTPGGGTSSGQTLTVTGPAINVSATTSPPGGSITATLMSTPNASKDWVALALVGSAPTVYVQWVEVSALSGNPKTWTVTMPATLGNYEFRYFLNNGYAEAAVSPAVTVENINPVPAISLLSGPGGFVYAGGPSFTMFVGGSNFVPSSVVQINGSARATTYVSATQLSVTVLAGDIASVATINFTVFNPTPGGGTSNIATFNVLAPPPVPVLTSISPNTVPVGGANFTLTASGSNFVPSSVVQVNGSTHSSLYVSANQLTATILSSDITAAGPLAITVFTPGTPGGGTSSSQTLTVTAAPAPVLTSISPTTVASGGATFTLTANGSSFTANSLVKINGTARGTSFVSASQLTATILASDIAVGGTPTITVFTPAPGGGTSSGQTLTVTGPAINVSATTSPPGGSITATLMSTPNASKDWVALALVGSAPTVYVQWVEVSALSGNPKTWTVNMPSTLGNYEFRYFLNNGYAEAAVSSSVAVANINPTPTISSLSPPSVVAGVAGFTLTVNGTGYVNGATATVGGISRAVTFVSATQVTVAVQASDVASAGSAAIVVTNPGTCTAGNCVSNSVNLSITAPPPAPVLTSINPNTVNAGGPNFTITATGSSFVPNSVVQINGVIRATVFVSATQLNATILAADIAAGGTPSITVFTPTPGGGTSSGQTLTVTAAATPVLTGISPTTVNAGLPNFPLTANGSNFSANSVVQVNGVNRATAFVSAAQLSATILAADVAAAGTPSIAVFTPGGGTSSAQSLTVTTPPGPLLTSISPTTVASGGAAFTLTANGAAFTGNSVVKINGAARATTFVSTTQLTATILASDIAIGGTPTITVFTSIPGGGTSSGQTLTVTGATINVSATTAPLGGPITATLMGTPNGANDWVALAPVGSPTSSYGVWVYVNTLSGNPKVWNLNMPSTAGTYEIRYFLNNGYTEAAVSPGIGVGNLNPTPSLDLMLPPSVAVGSPAFYINQGGAGLVNGVTATVGGVARAVTFISANQIHLPVQASDITTQGNVPIFVTNPGPCTGNICTSSPEYLVVTADPPAPTLTSINPTTASVGGGSFTLFVTGTNFTPNSIVQLNGSPAIATLYGSPTLLYAAILNTQIVSATTFTISVYTPPAGGGTSGTLPLPVQ